MMKKQDEIVYRHIFDAILEQKIPPKTKLSEESLCEIFSVSRTIIRKVLFRLSMENILTIQPNKGATVYAPTIDEAKQIIKARQVLEMAILELAIENRTKEKITEIKNLIDLEEDAIEKGDQGRAIRISGDFHVQLAQMAKNSALLNFQKITVSQCSLLISLYGKKSSQHTPLCALKEHRELVEAIEEGNTERAKSLMQAHLDHLASGLNLSNESTFDLHNVFSDVVNN
ncbi:GntR family transcriptional regulator [Vibrio sp. SS-MA-C1-2]|uniref:GntR family transcriptional regulator n=1 Tax=Vibrio sp. SS-MA-C1-2 TaxID=2908646 RepID=UPI001F45C5CA|nr:GntR family transcriptional regulator [Vibrio sp. SS-MA-C1-2]UJF17829.1 GntR family transcriptional regulator [Vibrio sp. SS-MA-C1-2]